jgi:type IV secretory pathway VirB10-like protein
VLRIASSLIVATWLFSSQSAAQQPVPQQPVPQQPVPQPPAPQQPVAQQPTAQPPQVGTPSLDPDRKTALVLLDRIETLVEDALQNDSDKSDKSDRDKSDKVKADKDKADKEKNKAVGTSGAEIKPGSLEAKSGRVTVDRAMLDEILSEVAQVKMMLQR